MRSWSPHADAEDVPIGFAVKGTSVLRDMRTGEAILAWHKTTRDRFDPFALGEQVAAGLNAGGLVPRVEIEPPAVSGDDLLSVYPLGDPHIGLYTWAA